MRQGHSRLEGAAEVQEFADDLEALLDGQVNLDDFKLKYGGSEVPDVIQDVMGSVWHFLADFDIRVSDYAYREIQMLEMCRLINHLRAGRLAEARRITFLRSTND
jgi:hypothetical protein